MPQGISLNLGLNSVDPAQYEGNLAVLKGCENDARDMFDIAVSQGFDARLLLGPEVLHSAVVNAIGEAAKALVSGDIFLLTFSGHGSKIEDPVNGDELDSQDETLVLYDKNLIDDELHALWKRFQPGVRIFFISDSCHSGTAAQVPDMKAVTSPDADIKPTGEEVDDGFFADNEAELDEDGEPRIVRSPTQVQQHRHVGRYGELYTAAMYLLTDKTKAIVGASIIQFGACQDNQKAFDGTRNGLFTGKLREVWADGGFQGTYNQFFEEIRDKTIPHKQDPNFFRVGAQSPEFEAQRPFSI